MKLFLSAGLLILICLGVYWPHKDAQFVLDDYYTVVRNPLIKNPSLYQNIWFSRIFDAHQSSDYIKFGYYRPVLESSWILDYRLFGLKPFGYQWVNLLIHGFNCLLIYLLIFNLFGRNSIALKTCLLFCVLPTNEWVVRYVTGRGDELSALFALMALLFLWRVLKTGIKEGYILVFLFWALAALTREVAISYVLYACLVYFYLSGNEKISSLKLFSFYWFLIGAIPFIALWSIIPKQGNILIWHTLYFALIGLCLWMAQLRLRWFVFFFALFATVSFYQGRYWTKEESLLRHTQRLELWPGTVDAQQLLMKYDDNIPAITAMVEQSHDPLIKAMWLRRLGLIYFLHKDFSTAQRYFSQALSLNPYNVDILDALAVVDHNEGQEAESLNLLNQSLTINPAYPDTLKILGIHYYIQKDFPRARSFLTRCLIVDPDNTQVQELLRLAKATN